MKATLTVTLKIDSRLKQLATRPEFEIIDDIDEPKKVPESKLAELLRKMKACKP